MSEEKPDKSKEDQMFGVRLAGGMMFRKSLGCAKRGSQVIVQSRSIFIDSESTPNPHSMKFMPGCEVLPEVAGTGMFFQNKDRREMMKSPK